MQGKKCGICKVVALLAGLGALNWGLVAFFNVNLVSAVLGDMTAPAKVAYALIGLAGVLAVLSVIKCCPCGKKDSGSCATPGQS